MKMRQRYSFITIFFILLVIILQYVNTTTYNTKIESILNNNLKNISLTQKIIHKNLKKLSNSVYHSVMEDSEFIEMFKKAYKASDKEKKLIRVELEKKVNRTLSYLKSKELEKIYFNFPDNTNFLRMHEPLNFGDNLSGIRDSVDYVSRYKKPVEGFSVLKNGVEFNFSFPIITDNQEYIGSMEITIMPDDILSILNDVKYTNAHFIMKKSALNSIIDENRLKKDYIQSYESDDFYQKKGIDFNETNQQILKDSFDKVSIEIDDNIKTEKSFTVYLDHGEIVSFIPIKGINSAKIQIYIIYYHDAGIIENIIIHYNVIFILLHIFLIILFYYMYKDYKYKNKILKLNSRLSNKIEKEISLKHDIEKQAKAFETLFEKSSDGISILENKKIIQCNKAMVNMFMYKSKDDMVKSHPSELSPELQFDGKKSFDKAEEMIKLSLQKGMHSFQWQHIRCSGEIFWTLITLTPISFLNRDVIHVTCRDISEEKDMENKLEKYTSELVVRVQEEVDKNKIQQEKLFDQTRLAQMGKMISMIAHQWRQPLGAISATSIDLKMKLELETFQLHLESDREKCVKYFNNSLDSIEEFVQTLTVTIDDFRNFYKPNKKSNLITVDIPIKKSLNVIRTSLKSNNIELNEEYISKKIVKIYENEMMQVILNILNNAQDNFIEKKIDEAKIEIKSYDIGDRVIIEICDNGGGIENSIINSIFDPYFSTKDEKQGTGLGLYMSKIIIESHHCGTIIAKNVNNGVCFIIELKGVL